MSRERRSYRALISSNNTDVSAWSHLTQIGWSLDTVWECELRDLSKLADRLREFLAKESDAYE